MERVYIIAEAGVNHNGDINIAYKLIDIAKEAGADAVKFQTAVPKLVMTGYATKAEYQKENDINAEESQIDMAERIHLPLNAYELLQEYCVKKEIEFLSTPFDLVSIQTLIDLKISKFKIPSGEITNYPYLKMIAEHGTPVILSTGMANLGDIENAINVLLEYGLKRENIVVLHATTEYPAPLEEVNLSAMKTISDSFKVKVGYSDHTKGIEIPVAAVALGATVIEKHFTLDKDMEGPDHKASLEPDELKEMVRCIRNVETSLGNGVKQATISEKKNMIIARKSIVANSDIKKDEYFTEDNLTTKRPGNGISPMLWNEIIGRKASKDFNADDLIEL